VVLAPHASAVLPKKVGFEVDAFLSELIFPPNEAARLVREVVAFSAERVADAGANEYRVRQIHGVVEVDVFQNGDDEPSFQTLVRMPPFDLVRPSCVSVSSSLESMPSMITNSCPHSVYSNCGEPVADKRAAIWLKVSSSLESPLPGTAICAF